MAPTGRPNERKSRRPPRPRAAEQAAAEPVPGARPRNTQPRPKGKAQRAKPRVATNKFNAPKPQARGELPPNVRVVLQDFLSQLFRNQSAYDPKTQRLCLSDLDDQLSLFLRATFQPGQVPAIHFSWSSFAIHQFITYMISNLPVHILNLDGNHIPPHFFELIRARHLAWASNIIDLSLEYCGIEDIERLDPLAVFPNVRVLHLRGNHFPNVLRPDTIAAQARKALPLLERVELDSGPVAPSLSTMIPNIAQEVLNNMRQSCSKFICPLRPIVQLSNISAQQKFAQLLCNVLQMPRVLHTMLTDGLCLDFDLQLLSYQMPPPEFGESAAGSFYKASWANGNGRLAQGLPSRDHYRARMIELMSTWLPFEPSTSSMQASANPVPQQLVTQQDMWQWVLFVPLTEICSQGRCRRCLLILATMAPIDPAQRMHVPDDNPQIGLLALQVMIATESESYATLDISRSGSIEAPIPMPAVQEAVQFFQYVGSLPAE